MPPKKVTIEEKHEIASVNSYNSEDDDETNPEETAVRYGLKSQFSQTISSINNFLNKDWIVPPENPDYNIVNRIVGIKYKIPQHKIPTFFDLLERCRIDENRIYFNESQNSEHSGIMFDFDIYQKTRKDQLIEPGILQGLVHSIVELLCKVIDFNKIDRESIHVGIIRRPAVTMDDTKKCYKDGFHMLIPGIKISRVVKRFIIRKIIDSGVLEMAFADVEPADLTNSNGSKYDRKDFLDINSAHVPCFFVGCSSKPGKAPYVLRQIYKLDIKKPDSDKPIITILNDTFDTRTNYCYEFSLNFQAENDAKIPKRNYEPRQQFVMELMDFERKVVNVEMKNLANLHGSISMLRLSDGQAEEIKNILDTIDVKYADDYNSWWRILSAVANISLSYRDLAEAFSARSSKYNPTDFSRFWRKIEDLTRRGKNHIGFYTLHEYAKQSNEKKLNEELQTTTYKMLCNTVYLHHNKGHLGHADISKLLYKLYKHKYATDRPPEQPTKMFWYEFITEDDDHSPGEIYKWKCHEGNRPNNLLKYISDVLPALFLKLYESIRRNLAKAIGDEAKYLTTMLTNFARTIQKLTDITEKKKIIEDAESRFFRQDFAKNFDKDPFVRGVLNGVLKLSNGTGKPQLIKGYHTLSVSKTMDAPYIPFNPHDPITKKIVMTIRQIFPNNEGDSHNFIMSYLASTIDGTFKESMFLIIVGRGANGKTVLTELHQSTLGLQYMGKLDLSCLTAQRSGPDNATPSTASIEGKTLIRFSEANRNEVLNTAKMKEWTGQETLAARRLHQNIINFRPRCHFLVTTNYDFTVDLQDHGTWRRILRFNCKIRFVDEENEVRNMEDPFQRAADPAVTTDWCTDPEVRGRYLGYLVWYHHWLYVKYKGKVRNVPHPHIAMETEQFRNEQDTMSAFINRFAVVTEEKTSIPLETEIPTYIRFLEKQGYKNVSEKGMTEVFLNSEVSKKIKKTARGYFIEGCRFLKLGESPKDDETFLKKQVEELTCDNKNFGIPIETPEEFYENLCAEYDKYKHIFDSKGDYQIDLDFLNEEKIPGQQMNGRQQVNENCPTAIDKKYASGILSIENKRMAHNGRLLPAGIEITPLEEPTFYEKPTINMEIARSLFVDESDSETDTRQGIQTKSQPSKQPTKVNPMRDIVSNLYHNFRASPDKHVEWNNRIGEDLFIEHKQPIEVEHNQPPITEDKQKTEATIPPKIIVEPKANCLNTESSNNTRTGKKLAIKFKKHKSPGPENIQTKFIKNKTITSNKDNDHDEEQDAEEQDAEEQDAEEQDAEEQDAEEQDAEEQDAEEQDAEEQNANQDKDKSFIQKKKLSKSKISDDYQIID